MNLNETLSEKQGGFRFARPVLRLFLPQTPTIYLAAVFFAWNAAHAAPRVLDDRMHHLRSGNAREWTEFSEEAKGPPLKLVFPAEPNCGPCTVRVRHRDVKQSWRLRLNDHEIGTLPSDENAMTTFWEVPTGLLRQGENTLVIAGVGNPSDDIEVGDVRLLDQPRKAALDEASLSVSVTDADDGKPVPARITVVDEFGSLMSVGAASSNRLAVRPGVVYTADGRAEFGLPAGRYKIYAGRGFEYSVDQKEIDLPPGARRNIALAIRREAPIAGYASCDTHVHTLTYSGHGDASLAERMVTLAAEGVELPIATDHNVQIDYRPALVTSGIESWFTPVAGNEVTTRVGHFNLFPLVLFVNGKEARRAEIPSADRLKGGIKYEATWAIARPPHDVYLVAVAVGPGVTGLYWPIAKPYQPDSSEWTPYTLGATGAVYVDADGSPGFSPARQYASDLVATSGDDFAALGRRLADYDEAVAGQVGAALRQRGLLTASTLEKLLPACPAPARAALREYLAAVAKSNLP